jgi:hypothetical protein
MLLERPRNIEQLLEIEVQQFGLVSVRWNGQLCGELVNKKVSEAAVSAPNRGEFGIFCEKSNTIISSARYLPNR